MTQLPLQVLLASLSLVSGIMKVGQACASTKKCFATCVSYHNHVAVLGIEWKRFKQHGCGLLPLPCLCLWAENAMPLHHIVSRQVEHPSRATLDLSFLQRHFERSEEALALIVCDFSNVDIVFSSWTSKTLHSSGLKPKIKAATITSFFNVSQGQPWGGRRVEYYKALSVIQTTSPEMETNINC